MEYIIVILILLFGAFKYNKAPESKEKKIWFAIEWLSIVLLAGLRYKVGGDSLSYYNEFYNKWPTLTTIDSFDKGRYGILWVYFIAICKTIINDFAFLQIVHAIITTSVFFWFFKKHTNNYFVAILFYFIGFFFRYNTEVIRGTLSVCMFLIGYDYLLKRKYVIYILTCILSWGFHTEGLFTFVIPVAFLWNKFNVSIENLLKLLIAAIVLMTSVNFLPFINNLLMGTAIYDNFQSYSSIQAKISFLGYVYLIIMSLPYLFLIRHYRLTKDYYKIKSFLILYFLLYFLSFRYSHIASRPMDFLCPLVLISLSDFLCNYNYSKYVNKIQLKIMNVAIVIMLLFSPVSRIVKNWILFYPYSSILNPEENILREQYFFYEIFNRN